MGKVNNCIKMLQILNSGRLFSIQELASTLETNPRNIIEYKRELEECGCIIETKRGRYGGYRLAKSFYLPSANFSKHEATALRESFDYAMKQKDFLLKDDLSSAIGKLFSSTEDAYDDYFGDKNTKYMYISKQIIAMPEEELLKRYSFIKKAIANLDKVEISYLSNDNIVRKRIIHPYDLYVFNDAWFVIALCELKHEFRYFKLNRISKFKLANQKFTRNVYYKLSDYLGEFGMTKNGSYYHIKLKFTGAAAMYVKDYIYGKNQIIDSSHTEFTVLSCEMQYKNNIINFVLGFGGDCEVLEPEWLKEEVVNKAQVIIAKNKK